MAKRLRRVRPVERLGNDRHPFVWQVVLFALWLAWVSNFMVRSALAPGLVGIRAEFGLSHGEGGLLATTFLLGYTSTMLPGSLLGDRFGRRPMVIVAALGWTMASLLIALAPSFAALLACMVGLGLVMGLFNGNDRPIVSTVTPAERMGVGQGLSYTGLGVGNGLGVVVAGALAAAWGWRAGFLAFAGVSLLALAALWRFVPDLPRTRTSPLRPIAAQVLGNRDLWLLYLSGITSVGAVWLLVTWSPTMLLEATGLDLATVSLLASCVGFASVPALVGVGALSDRLARRGLGRKVVIAASHGCLAVTLAATGLAIEQRWATGAIVALLLATSLCHWAAWAPTYALLADITPRPALGLAFGLGHTIWALGAVAVPWLAGAARDVSGSFGGPFYALAAFALLSTAVVGAVRPAYRLGPERKLALPTA